MWLLYPILLIILGLLAIPSLVLAKKPNAKAMFDKLAPYQGWIGVVFTIWGLFGIIGSLISIASIAHSPILWIMDLAVALLEFALGFILAYNLIVKYVLSKNEKAAAKGEQLLKKLLPLQGTLGIIAIVLGALYIVLYIVIIAAAVAVAAGA